MIRKTSSARHPIKRRVLRASRLLGLLAAAGFLGLNLLARNHARSMMYYSDEGVRTTAPEQLSTLQRALVLIRGVNLPRPHGSRTPASLGLDEHALTIELANGVTLGAWWLPSDGAPSPLAILFHGYGGDKATLLEEARIFHQLGCGVLLVDFRGSGASSESYATLGLIEAEDVRAAYDYARAHLGGGQIVLYGQSMGAAAILRAIAVEQIRPDAVVLEAVFDNMLRTVRNRFEAMRVPSFPAAELLVFWGGRLFGENAFRHNPSDYARHLSCPVLFFHGADDPRARLEDARRVYEAVPGDVPRQLIVFEGVGHSSTAARFEQTWKDALTSLLAKDVRGETEIPPGEAASPP